MLLTWEQSAPIRHKHGCNSPLISWLPGLRQSACMYHATPSPPNSVEDCRYLVLTLLTMVSTDGQWYHTPGRNDLRLLLGISQHICGISCLLWGTVLSKTSAWCETCQKIDLRIYYTRIYIYIYLVDVLYTYIRIFSHEFRLAFIKQVGLAICSHHGTFTCWDWLDGRSDSLDRDGANPLEETPTCGGREGENTDPKHLISSSERKWKGQDNKECKLNPIKAAIHSLVT